MFMELTRVVFFLFSFFFCFWFFDLTSKTGDKGPYLTYHKINLLNCFLVIPKDPFFRCIHMQYVL